MQSVSRSRKLLLGCLAGAALAIAASPAAAGIYELTYHTQSQDGDIFFYAPPPNQLPPTPGQLPGLIVGLVANGTVIPGVNGGNPMFSTETTFGFDPCPAPSCFNNSGTLQLVTQLLPAGGFINAFGGVNNNLLQTFIPNVSPNPPTSSLENTWFDSNGIAFQAQDGTVVAVLTFDDGSGPRLLGNSLDIFGNEVYASRDGGQLDTISYLGAPGPAPATGYLGLFGLALAAAALKLRERFAR